MPQLKEIYELSLVKNRGDKGQRRVVDGGLEERIITQRDEGLNSDTLSHRIHTSLLYTSDAADE